ncbi:MAG: hypothetical protein NVS9B10_02950 [Nevskia sp.]
MADSIAVPDKLVVFAHGKESGPWGTKITRLAETARQRGFEVISPDYSHTVDARARLQQLLALAPQASSALVLAGSSMGGYVSAMACAALRPQALLLIAPALYFPGYDEEPPPPPPIHAVVHGWRDDIVPVERAIRYAQRHRGRLHLLDSDHGLNDRLPELAELFDDLLARAATLGAYRLARYVVGSTAGKIELRAGQLNAATDAALADRCGVRRNWAFVTACNPDGRRLSNAENAALTQQLLARLEADGIAHTPGYGTDDAGAWGCEASALLRDPPEHYAEALAREFRQNAILCGALGGAPDVLWLR